MVALGSGIRNYNKIQCRTISILPNRIQNNDLIISKLQHRYYKNFGHKRRPDSRISICYNLFLVTSMSVVATAYFW